MDTAGLRRLADAEYKVGNGMQVVQALRQAADELDRLRERMRVEETEKWIDLHDQARAECERLREVNRVGCECSAEDACRFVRERDEARARLARAREVLERYAGPAWKSTTTARGGQQVYAPIDRDGGQRAREVLNELGDE